MLARCQVKEGGLYERCLQPTRPYLFDVFARHLCYARKEDVEVQSHLQHGSLGWGKPVYRVELYVENKGQQCTK